MKLHAFRFACCLYILCLLSPVLPPPPPSPHTPKKLPATSSCNIHGPSTVPGFVQSLLPHDEFGSALDLFHFMVFNAAILLLQLFMLSVSNNNLTGTLPASLTNLTQASACSSTPCLTYLLLWYHPKLVSAC